jgi:hypothetical protein
MRMGGITHTKIEAISLERVCEVILASTEASVKLTVLSRKRRVILAYR